MTQIQRNVLWSMDMGGYVMLTLAPCTAYEGHPARAVCMAASGLVVLLLAFFLGRHSE